MEPGTSEGIKARAQEEGKVEGMRKEISSSETEIDCGRVRWSITWLKIENTLIKSVHATSLCEVANVIDNRHRIQEVMLECGNDELKQNEV